MTRQRLITALGAYKEGVIDCTQALEVIDAFNQAMLMKGAFMVPLLFNVPSEPFDGYSETATCTFTNDRYHIYWHEGRFVWAMMEATCDDAKNDWAFKGSGTFGDCVAGVEAFRNHTLNSRISIRTF